VCAWETTRERERDHDGCTGACEWHASHLRAAWSLIAAGDTAWPMRFKNPKQPTLMGGWREDGQVPANHQSTISLSAETQCCAVDRRQMQTTRLAAAHHMHDFDRFA
jgi:hypothetical protein